MDDLEVKPYIEDLGVAATARSYDSAVAVPVYRPSILVSFPLNGAYSKTLNKYVGIPAPMVEKVVSKYRGSHNDPCITPAKIMRYVCSLYLHDETEEERMKTGRGV